MTSDELDRPVGDYVDGLEGALAGATARQLIDISQGFGTTATRVAQRERRGRRYAAHSGGAIGGRSALVVYLDESLSVAVLANSEGERLLGPAHELARALLEETTD